MLSLSSDDFVQHDLCPRSRTWDARYLPFRVTLNRALNESIWKAISQQNPASANDAFIAFARAPGIDMEGANLYDSVIHHARLSELLAQYCLSVLEAPRHHGPVNAGWGQFNPRALLLPDGRLWRLILADRWNGDRQKAESLSWRTMADSSILNRPMLHTVILIGASREGFRLTPWTECYEHPITKEFRFQLRLRAHDKERRQFHESWDKRLREQTNIKPLEWLKVMQDDGVFEGRVLQFSTDVPQQRAVILEQLTSMAAEMHSGSLDQRPSSCYRFRPCQYLNLCSQNVTPAQLGWLEKDSVPDSENATLPVISD